LDYLTTRASLSTINNQQVASYKVYQLLVHGRWFSPGTPASSTTKTGRHDIAEALLKVALNTQKNQLRRHFEVTHCTHIVPKNV
jgi:hypothetical protein